MTIKYDLPTLRGSRRDVLSAIRHRDSIFNTLQTVSVAPGSIKGTYMFTTPVNSGANELFSPNDLGNYILVHDSSKVYTKKEAETKLQRIIKKLSKITSATKWFDLSGRALSSILYESMIDTYVLNNDPATQNVSGHAKTPYPVAGDFVIIKEWTINGRSFKGVVSSISSDRTRIEIKTEYGNFVDCGILSGEIPYIIRKDNQEGMLEL